jgi:S-adenosylmethionine:tRNA ribosyltransferase-isomerase
MLRTADLDYPLPEELIATTPAAPRDAARLLVVSRSDPARLEHRTVRELAEVLGTPTRRVGSLPDATRDAMAPGDLMVVNATRVLPARFKGVRADTLGQAEGLYLGPYSHPPTPTTLACWTVLLKMRRMKPGVVVRLFDRRGKDGGVSLRLIERTGEDGAAWIVGVERSDASMNASDVLEHIGLTPVPPYILASRKKSLLSVPDEQDRSTYQTVYATDRDERAGWGSVAAPTAGLHFTPELLARLEASGVRRAEVTLDVSLGTFKPIEAECVEQHPMHAEWCHVPEKTARATAAIRGTGLPARVGRMASPEQGLVSPCHGSRGRIIAVGTTAARTLESFESPEEMLRVGSKETRLLITPGYRFRHMDALLTNFHLPRSTLMAMVAAFLAPRGAGDPMDGVARLRAIYAEAVRERYRFYSYGDAMLVLP